MESTIRGLVGRWWSLQADVTYWEYGGYQDQDYPGDFVNIIKGTSQDAELGATLERNLRTRLTPELSSELRLTHDLMALTLGVRRAVLPSLRTLLPDW